MRLFKNGSFNPDWICNLASDIDGTTWNQYNAAQDEEKEYGVFAQEFGISVEELRERITREKSILRERYGRKFSMYEVLLILEINDRRIYGERLEKLREKIYKPSRGIKSPDTLLCAGFKQLLSAYGIVFHTNSPVPVGEEVIKLLGLQQLFLPATQLVWGFENLGVFKPNPEFFANLTMALGWDPITCLSIGDSKHKDGLAAISAGFGAAIIVDKEQGPADLGRLIPLLKDKAWEEIISLCEPDGSSDPVQVSSSGPVEPQN